MSELYDQLTAVPMDEVMSWEPAAIAWYEQTLAREKALLSPANFAVAHSEGRWKPYRHLEYTSDAIVDMLDHDACDLLLVDEPVRHGKSELCSMWTPSWYIARTRGRNRCLLSSYEADFARGWGRKVRDIIKELGPLYGLEPKKDVWAQDAWELEQRGGMATAGANGPLTGKGGHLLIPCVGETEVDTPSGKVRLDELTTATPYVKAFDHSTGQTTWARLAWAGQTGTTDDIYEIESQAGHRIRCTGDHRVWTEHGYIEARQVRQGMRLLRQTNDQRQDMLAGLLEPTPETEPEALSVWKRDQETSQVLLDRMPETVRAPQQRTATTRRVRGMYPSIQTCEQNNSDVLTAMRFDPTLDQNDRSRKLELATWNRVHSAIQETSATNPSGRWGTVRRLLKQRFFARPSHRPQSAAQRNRELGDSVPTMPHDPSQVAYDTVSVAGPVRTSPVPVYCLTLPETGNVFANDLLISQCDDPVKSKKEADSPTYRRDTWEWWDSVWTTRRMGAGTKYLLIMSRWHVDDLMGRLLAAEQDLGMRIKRLHLPALAEDNDQLGRRPGEALCPELYDEEALNNIRKSSPLGWPALYQQRPIAQGGGLFKRDNFQTYDTTKIGEDVAYQLDDRLVDSKECMLFGTMDTAYTRNKHSDYTALAVWAVPPQGETPNDLLLLDMRRVRIEGADHANLIQQVWNDWPQLRWIGVEKIAASMALFTEAQRNGVLMKWLKPDGNKVARAETAMGLTEQGRLWLPRQASWLDDYLEEMVSFPSAAHDDMVDVTSYAASELVKRSVRGKAHKQQPRNYEDRIWEKVQKMEKQRNKHNVLGSWPS